MEPIKIEIEIALSETTKSFLAGLVASLLNAPKAHRATKKAEIKDEPPVNEEEPVQEENEPETAEIKEPAKTLTVEDARLAINKARERGIENDAIRACLPNGKRKVTDLTPEEIAEFIKKVEEL